VQKPVTNILNHPAQLVRILTPAFFVGTYAFFGQKNGKKPQKRVASARDSQFMRLIGRVAVPCC
jgi:hypothetical protein